MRVFEAAARSENFARAAEQLNMSTSAVSQQVKALESHFGAELFKRGPRHVELTDAGHAFLPAVQQSLNQVEEAASSLFGRGKDNTLMLLSDLIFTSAWLTPRLPDFAARHPGVQMHISGAFHDLDYQRPGFELRILFGPVHRSWAQCDRLFDETIYPVARPDIADSIESPGDFLKQRLIQISSHRVNWNHVLRAQGIETIPNRQLCFTESTQIALPMAACGYGIALARAPTTNYLVERLGLKPCATSPGIDGSEAYYLVYQNTESLSAAARRFRGWLLEQARAADRLPA
ncbi:MAG: LysR family transcriptional regulator [Gammaproteobacteria bacterium]|nr:LysR family transcriptional regulator [Gammaproteobacteria bacterium]MDH3446965.1 LysR family transcriptional regulator [Gammaproteobacteria bacterium]